MTRKRFVKKLMGYGATRNWAEEQANAVKPGQSYEKAYFNAATMVVFANCGVSAEEAARAINRMTAAIMSLSEKVTIEMELPPQDFKPEMYCY